MPNVAKNQNSSKPLYEIISARDKNNVKLNLDFRTLWIGSIQGDTYTKKINLSKHQFKKFPSIGFNLDLLENEKFTWINIDCGNGKILETSRKYVLIHGKRQTFSKQGYEKQIFLGLHLFSRAEAEKFENAEALKPDYKQLTLFS
jgi:hypothetical protein